MLAGTQRGHYRFIMVPTILRPRRCNADGVQPLRLQQIVDRIVGGYAMSFGGRVGQRRQRVLRVAPAARDPSPA